jgi:hypothetical protein
MSGSETRLDDLGQFTDQLMKADPQLRRFARRIVRLQGMLQRELTPKGRRIFLSLEETVNERWLEVLGRLCSLLRAEGSRRGQRSRARVR